MHSPIGQERQDWTLMDRIGIFLNGVSPVLIQPVSADFGLAIFLPAGVISIALSRKLVDSI